MIPDALRPPVEDAVEPANLPPLLTIAVIGAGQAGRLFALAALRAGHHVILEDVMPANLRRAEAEFTLLSEAETGGGTGTTNVRFELVLTVEDAVERADLAIDFVPDELESKLEIFSLIDRMAPPRTILCTPSDALSITDLASCTYRPDRCVAIRNLFEITQPLRVLYPPAATRHTLALTRSLFSSLERVVSAELDPEAPMLMKNIYIRP